MVGLFKKVFIGIIVEMKNGSYTLSGTFASLLLKTPVLKNHLLSFRADKSEYLVFGIEIEDIAI